MFKEELLLGEYQIVRTLRADPVFRWVEAEHAEMRRPVLLQILQPDVATDHGSEAIEYFDRLRGLGRRGLWLPDQILGDYVHPLVLQYHRRTVQPLSEVGHLEVSDLEEYLRQASDALHVLHNGGLEHGLVRPDSFVLFDGQLWLTNFGYAPLLRLRHSGALREAGAYLAPEVSASGTVTPVSDIYGFAQLAAALEPELRKLAWFAKAANPDPRLRFEMVRDAFKALQAPATEPSRREEPRPLGPVQRKPESGTPLEPDPEPQRAKPEPYLPKEVAPQDLPPVLEQEPHRGGTLIESEDEGDIPEPLPVGPPIVDSGDVDERAATQMGWLLLLIALVLAAMIFGVFTWLGRH